MAHLILMPKAGQSMTEGRVVAWLKEEGQSVERGEPLLEIETDKANLEVEALESGILRKVFVPEGDVCPVLAPVGVLGGKDEEIDFDEIRKSAPSPEDAGGDAEAPPPDREEASGSAPGATSKDAPSAIGTADPSAAEPGPRDTAGGGSPRAPAGALPSSPAAARSSGGDGRILASPRARRVARERGVDLATLRGSGPGGRIVEADIRGATRGYGLPAPAGCPPPSPRPPASVPLEGMRRAIARALTDSVRSIPHFYATVPIDVTNALRLREERSRNGGRLSVNDLIVRAVALALRDEPRVNCRVFDDRIEYPEDINIGIAVGSDEGLVVPVLLRARDRSLEEIARETRELIAAAREGKLAGAGQGTFTISNLGMFGIESFTAIINPPEGAILAVGAAREELVASGGGFFPRSILRVTLSSDHRAIDGLLAARFLQRLRYFLETTREL